MSTTHIGKIGRLARSIRQILGERIEEGIPNKDLVQWLNGLHHVKEVLAQRFGGRAITEQNLSEWRHSGHVEWLRREERRGLALHLLEQREEDAMEPGEALAEKEVSDRLGQELGMEMARLALALVEQEGNTEARWKRLCAVYREVSQVRRDDHRAERTRIERERWQHELDVEQAAAEKQERKEHNLNLFAGCATHVSLKILEQALAGIGGTGVRPSMSKEPEKAPSTESQVAVPAEVLAYGHIASGHRMANGTEEAHDVNGRDSEAIETPPNDEGIRPNPTKSNQDVHAEDAEDVDEEPIEDEVLAYGHLASGPQMANGTEEAHDVNGRDVEAIETSPNDEEIRLNPSKSNQEIENEAWLKAMNFT